MTTRSNAEIVAHDVAGRLGLKLTEEGNAAVLDILASNLKIERLDDQRIATTITDGDEDRGAVETFQRWSELHPSWFERIAAPSTAASQRRPAQTVTERMVELKQTASRDRKAEAAELVERHGNPFASATRNMTRQALLKNLDPELAGRMRAKAAGLYR